MTGKGCGIYLFSAVYDSMQDVQISTWLTVYTDEYGRTWILALDEVLWFGTSMDHSLMNPNQIWMTGIPVSDDPFDYNRKLGIACKKMFIPLRTDGNTVYMLIQEFQPNVRLHNVLTLSFQLKRNGILSRFNWRWYRLIRIKKAVKYVRLQGLQKLAILKSTEWWAASEMCLWSERW